MNAETDSRSNNISDTIKKVFNINLNESPNTCLIKLYQRRYNALVDTGAEISVIHQNVFKSLPFKHKLSKTNARLQSVNGGSLSVIGSTEISFYIGNQRLTHKFIVATGINKNVILGKDWLTKFGVRLYFDLKRLRIGKRMFLYALTYIFIQLYV